MSKMSDLHIDIIELFELGYSASLIAEKLSLPIEMVKPVCEDLYNDGLGNYESDY
jgi:hypothetical protein